MMRVAAGARLASAVHRCATPSAHTTYPWVARAGAVACGLLVAGTPALARADAPTVIDLTEHMLGATNVSAVAGHGGLTAGISDEGDLTVLSWPGPSYADQLAYLASNDLAARSEPHMGAAPGMGAFLGLRITSAQGTQVAWLRDASFAHPRPQDYTQPDAPVPRTVFASADLGLTVTVIDVVSPDVDVLTRRVLVARAAGSPVTGVALVSYENLSPTLSRIAEVPVADWLLDGRNDFLAVYDRQARAVVHVHPSDRAVARGLVDLLADPTQVDYGPADALMRRASPSDADVDAFVAGLDAAYPPGVAAIVTTEPPPAEFQVGADATPTCGAVATLVDDLKKLPAAFPEFHLPVSPGLLDAALCTDALPAVSRARGWQWAPEDALADAADGHLSGSRLAACQTNAAMIAPLTFEGDVAEGSAVFAFGRSVADARAALTMATRVPAAQRQAAAEAAAHAALGSAALPDASLGARTVQVAQRALVNVYVARDRASGAVVASISRQPPYFLDWPRDGAFVTQAMDVAGLLPWATQRDLWYVGLQRSRPAPGNPLLDPAGVPTDPDTGVVAEPADAWEMSYYADGTVGGNVRWEIDNTALHLWSVVGHAAALEGADRAAFVAKVWPSFARALHLLVRWKDAATGLPWPANEDDDTHLTSTLHGATAVYAALVAGARLGHFVGDEGAAREALARAAELGQALEGHYVDPATGLFVDTPPPPGEGPPPQAAADTAWLVWPARFFDADDPRLEKQLAHDMAAVMPAIEGRTAGGAYVLKNVVAAALLGRDGGSRDTARTAVRALADMATPGTLHFGEVFVTTHPGGSAAPVFSQRVATPHVWEGVLFYLSAMALSSPAAFDAQAAAFPLPPAPSTYEARGGGCSMAAVRARAGAGGSWRGLGPVAAAFGLVALAVARLRRRAKRATDAKREMRGAQDAGGP